MNIAKDFCDCIISWEAQENRKISSVVHCSYYQGKIDKPTTGDGYGTKITDEIEKEFLPVLLTPFLHPELTKASYCDLKIFVSPKLAVKFNKVIIVSTAKMIEFADKNGESTTPLRGDKMTVDRGKEDLGERSMAIGTGRGCKSSSRWFINEYVPSTDIFELMVRFCDHLVPNQLFIKYIGVKVVAHDWSVELGSFNLAAPVTGPNVSGPIGSTGSICSNTMTLNCDKVMDAIQNVNNAVQILANEVGCIHKGSNPHLSTISSLDSSTLFKHRRPNSPMTPGTTSPSANYWSGVSTRKNSDVTTLQLWLETRLTAIEMSVVKGLEKLSSRISQLEMQLGSQTNPINDLHNNGNQLDSQLSTNSKNDSNNKPNESSNEQNSSCQSF